MTFMYSLLKFALCLSEVVGLGTVLDFIFRVDIQIVTLVKVLLWTWLFIPS